MNTKYIYSVEVWQIKKEYLKDNDIVYDLIVGQEDIYPLAYPIIRTISKLNYEKLLNKEYFIEVRTDLEELILIYDQNNNYIPPVPGDKIPLKNKSKTKLFKKTKNDQV